MVPAFGAGLLLDGLLRPPAGAQPIDRVSFAVLMGLLTWFGWLVGQTALHVDEDGLRVTNFGRFHRVPWSAIESVREDQEVVVTLRAGQKIRLVAGGGSLLGSILGGGRQRELAVLVERHCAAGGPVTAAEHGWRLHVAPALGLIALAAGVAWLHG